MTILATENARLSNVLKKELWAESGYCRTVVTVNEAAARAYVPGTVLGRVTANGTYRIAVQTASDGSQVADAIVLAEQAIPAATATSVVVLVKGPAAVSKAGLVLDATYDLLAERNAVYAALEAKGIQVLDAA
jgi:uncharacterized protein (UPF0548 family)